MRKCTLATLLLLFVVAFVLVVPHRAEAQKPPSDVVVINNPTTPVPTRDVDNPATQPIQVQAVAGVGTLTGPANFVLFTVPAGKRLVVEHFSSEVGIASTASVNRYALVTDQNFAFVAPAFHSPCGTCAGTTELFIASQPIRMYVDAGQALVVNITFSGAVGPSGFGFFSVSGYLVDVP